MKFYTTIFKTIVRGFSEASGKVALEALEARNSLSRRNIDFVAVEKITRCTGMANFLKISILNIFEQSMLQIPLWGSSFVIRPLQTSLSSLVILPSP